MQNWRNKQSQKTASRKTGIGKSTERQETFQEPEIVWTSPKLLLVLGQQEGMPSLPFGQRCLEVQASVCSAADSTSFATVVLPPTSAKELYELLKRVETTSQALSSEQLPLFKPASPATEAE